MASERQLIESVSPWWGEHVYRYEYVLKKVNKKSVILDLACGTGYGASMLAKDRQNRVVGGDISEEALRIAKLTYQQENLSFKKLDGLSLLLDDNSFDIITSFETIEHITQHKKLIKEFHRVLKPGGKLFLSTPNSLITSPDGKIVNPFHVKEFKPDELVTVLEQVFSKVKLYGQSYTRYDNNKSLIFKITSVLEKVFYQRGIRKLPIKFQNYIMNILIQKSFYPESSDFSLFEDERKIQSSFVLFVECEK